MCSIFFQWSIQFSNIRMFSLIKHSYWQVVYTDMTYFARHRLRSWKRALHQSLLLSNVRYFMSLGYLITCFPSTLYRKQELSCWFPTDIIAEMHCFLFLLMAESWFIFDEGLDAFEAAIAAVSKYGGAMAGYRTMLDALIPASNVLREVSGDNNLVCICYFRFLTLILTWQSLDTGIDSSTAFVQSSEAALSGAESTKQMTPQVMVSVLNLDFFHRGWLPHLLICLIPSRPSMLSVAFL